MTEPSGDEEDRMLSIFRDVKQTELDYLLAMLELPDGVGRMRLAMQTLLNESSVFQHRGARPWHPLERRRREKLFVLLGDVVKLPRRCDVAAVGNWLLGLDIPFEQFRLCARRQVMYRYWMELQKLPSAEQDRLIGALIKLLADRPDEEAMAG